MGHDENINSPSQEELEHTKKALYERARLRMERRTQATLKNRFYPKAQIKKISVNQDTTKIRKSSHSGAYFKYK